MTVERLRNEMSNLEFMQWTRYYAVKAQARELETKAAEARASRGG